MQNGDVWYKSLSLFKKGVIYYRMIEVNLQEHKQFQLLEHFRLVVSGTPSFFHEQITLYKSNSHYKQFVDVLNLQYSRDHLSQINRFQGLTDQNAIILIQEISLKELNKRSIHDNLEYLNRYALFLQSQLKNLLAKQMSNTDSKQVILSKLFLFSQYAVTLQILYDFKQITMIECLLLLLILKQLNLTESKVYLYDQSATNKLYQKLLLESPRHCTQQSECRSFMLFFRIFLPYLRKNHQDKYRETVIDILT